METDTCTNADMVKYSTHISFQKAISNYFILYCYPSVFDNKTFSNIPTYAATSTRYEKALFVFMSLPLSGMEKFQGLTQQLYTS